jgi:hypothetical protein
MIELYEVRTDTIYWLGYKDDKYVVTKKELNESVSWDIECVRYGGVANSSKLGKKLINFIREL